MSNLVKKFEEEQIAKLTETKEVPEFAAGDTVRVAVRVIDGANERIQNYEGVVIAKRNRGVASSFVVRKISYGEGVERRFLTYSPIVKSITVVRRGIVRRAKLFYLRELSGKAARIKEKVEYTKKDKSVTKGKATKSKIEATKPAETKAEAKKD